jgi:hypothetical protein
MGIPPPGLLSRAEDTYRLALYEKEKIHARQAEAFRLDEQIWHYERHYSHRYLGINHLHRHPLTRADRLHCFTCSLRRLKSPVEGHMDILRR